MASIEQRGCSFRVVFRYRGRKFTRSLLTADERQASATLARLEDNLRRVELGTLAGVRCCDRRLGLTSTDSTGGG